jgi:hypothetical protein
MTLAAPAIERLERPLASLAEVARSLSKGNVCIVLASDCPSGSSSAWIESPSVFSSPSVDGCWLDQPPPVVGLMCAAESDGCDCVFVSAAILWEALSARFSENEIAPLFGPDALSLKLGSSMVHRPGFIRKSSLSATRIACNFSARLDWHASPSAMARPVFDFCREFVLQDSNQLICRLKVGECALVPNMLVMNGCAAAPDSGRLEHVWFTGSADISADVRSFAIAARLDCA